MADKVVEVKLTLDASGFKKGSDDASRSTNSFTQNLAHLNQATQLVQRGVSDVVKIVSDFIELGARGAAVQAIEQQFYRVSGSAEAAEQNLAALRDATRGMVSDAELMRQGITMLSLQLAKTPDELNRTAKTVTALGRTFGGFSADRSMQDYLMMIANESEMRFDQFGINATKATARIEELTEAGMDSHEAFKTAVDEQMIQTYEKLGLGAETAADGFGQLSADAQNFGDEIAQDLMPLAVDAVGTLGSLLDGLKNAWDGLKVVGVTVIAAFNAAMYTWGDILQGSILRLMQLKSLLEGNAQAAEDFGKSAADAWSRAFSGETAQSAMLDTIERLYSDNIPAAMDNTANAADEMAAEIEEAEQALADVEKKIADDISEVYGDMREGMADDAIDQARRAEDEIIAAMRREQDAAREQATEMENIQSEYANAMQSAQDEYQSAVSQAQSQYSNRRLDIERNFQKRMRDIQHDYEVSRQEAIDSRDALALEKAEQQKDEQVAIAEEQRNDEMAEAAQQYQEQMIAAATARQQAEAAAAQAMQASIARLREQVQQELEEQRIADARRIEDENLARKREEEDRQRWLNRRIEQIRAANAQELSDAQQHYNAMAAISSGAVVTGQVHGGRASGGYAGYGVYTLGEAGREFVLNAQTTRSLESAMSGPLTQQSVMSLASGGSSRVNVNQNFTFNGSLSSDERQWYRQVARDQAVAAFREVIG